MFVKFKNGWFDLETRSFARQVIVPNNQVKAVFDLDYPEAPQDTPLEIFDSVFAPKDYEWLSRIFYPKTYKHTNTRATVVVFRENNFMFSFLCAKITAAFREKFVTSLYFGPGQARKNLYDVCTHDVIFHDNYGKEAHDTFPLQIWNNLMEAGYIFQVPDIDQHAQNRIMLRFPKMKFQDVLKQTHALILVNDVHGTWNIVHWRVREVIQKPDLSQLDFVRKIEAEFPHFLKKMLCGG